MRIQPSINKDEVSKDKIYDVYSKYANGSVSIEINNELTTLKSFEFKFLH